MERVARRIRDRYGDSSRRADHRRHRQPQSGLDLRGEHRAAPGRCSKRAAGVPTVKQIVVASSDKAYGDHETLPYSEDAPLQGRHPYDVSKSCADLIAQTYGVTYDLPVGDHALRQLLRRRRPQLEPHRARHDSLDPARPASGHSLRRAIYTRLFLCRRRRGGQHDARRKTGRGSEPCAAQAFNFSNEIQVTVLDLVERILKLMDSALEPDVRNEATNEIRHQYLSAEKARESCSTGNRSLRSTKGCGARLNGTETFWETPQR